MDLYREIILEHYNDPRNTGSVLRADMVGDAINTTCGDTLRLEVQLDEGGRIADIRFTGDGCAVSQASASLFTEKLKGTTLEDLRRMNRDEIFQLLGGPVNPGRENCALLVLKARDKAVAKQS